jgi:hypothetical protein
MSTRRVVSGVAAAAAVVPAAVVGLPSPAAAQNDDVCLGDFDGFRVEDVKPLRSSSGATAGQVLLYYNPGNRCVFGKTSLSRDLRADEDAGAQLEKPLPPPGSDPFERKDACEIVPGSAYCITDKFYDGGFVAQVYGGWLTSTGTLYQARTKWW